MAPDESNLTRAKNAVLSHDYDKAIEIYREILADDAGNVEVRLLLAKCYEKAEDDNNALHAYRSIILMQRDNIEVLIAMAGVYRRLGDNIAAVNTLDKALLVCKTDVQKAQIYYNMGNTFKLMGRYNDAVKCLNSAIETNPNDVLAYNYLGVIYSSYGQHEKALSIYTKAFQIDKNHPLLHYNSALSYIALKKYPQAKLAFENALRTRPGWIEAMISYAGLLTVMNRDSDAKRILLQVQKLKDDEPSLYNAFARLSFKQKNYVQAESYYKQAMEKDPANFEAMQGLGLTLERLDKYVEAEKIYAELESFDEENPISLLQHARVLLQMNQLDMAYSKILFVNKRDSQNPEALNLLAQYYALSDQHELCKDVFPKIKEIDPDYLSHFYDCALIYKKKGEYEKAKELLKEYLQIKNDDDRAITLMSALCQLTDDIYIPQFIEKVPLDESLEEEDDDSNESEDSDEGQVEVSAESGQEESEEENQEENEVEIDEENSSEDDSQVESQDLETEENSQPLDEDESLDEEESLQTEDSQNQSQDSQQEEIEDKLSESEEMAESQDSDVKNEAENQVENETEKTEDQTHEEEEQTDQKDSETFAYENQFKNQKRSVKGNYNKTFYDFLLDGIGDYNDDDIYFVEENKKKPSNFAGQLLDYDQPFDFSLPPKRRKLTSGNIIEEPAELKKKKKASSMTEKEKQSALEELTASLEKANHLTQKLDDKDLGKDLNRALNQLILKILD
ncbi:MAG: tetratricopeptide repeat protein [Treponemataceae bacterium]|nr:tetratricopeptide repeat protein [Treponemataceae bacterium]